MLSVSRYTREYIDGCRARIELQLAAYRSLVGAAGSRLDAAIEEFEPLFLSNLLLALDNSFCHRSRILEGKDGNPLNEVRMLCNSVLHNHDVMTADKTIRFDPARSVTEIPIGGEIRLREASFVPLFEAFMSEIESKYL